MLLNQEYLYTPGPTPIPDRVKTAMNRPMIGHRSSAFPVLLQNVAERLQPVFGSENPVTLLSTSGTGALEAAAVNTVETGDHVVVIVTGAFGERFAKICEAFGANVHRLETEWGKACGGDELEAFLKKTDKKIKAVFATYCETSTALINPIKELGEVTKRETDGLFIVDGVSCIGAVPVDMKAWNIDILVSGSQKALMLPPGLAFVAANDRARDVIKKNDSGRFYLNLNSYFNSYDKEHSTPFTPPVSLIYGAQEVCAMIEEEGFENVIERHKLLKKMTREGIKALGYPLLTSDEDGSPTVTAVKPPEGLTDSLTAILQDQFSFSFGEGQQKLKGQIFRIGHMGYSTPFDVLRVLSGIEMAASKAEGKNKLGLAVKRAEEVWLDYV